MSDNYDTIDRLALKITMLRQRIESLEQVERSQQAIIQEQDAKLAELEAIVNEVGSSGFTDIDERLVYVEVQLDRENWEELRRLRTYKGEGE